jgi:hypothetical protein
LIRIKSVVAALHDESRETDELSEGTDLLLGSMPHGVFLLGLGYCERIRSLGLEAGGVEGVVLVILLGLKVGLLSLLLYLSQIYNDA